MSFDHRDGKGKGNQEVPSWPDLIASCFLPNVATAHTLNAWSLSEPAAYRGPSRSQPMGQTCPGGVLKV